MNDLSSASTIDPPSARPTVVSMHPSVQSVVAFMNQTLPGDEMVDVANAVAELAPVLWGRYKRTDGFYPLTVSELPIQLPVCGRNN